MGPWPSVFCVLASVWTALNAVLGRVATTCTTGDDRSWVAAAIVSAPAVLLIWWLLLRMILRGFSPGGRRTAIVALPLVNIFLLPTLAFGIRDAGNLFVFGGSLCGSGYEDYAPELSDLTYWATRSLIVLYFNAVPLLTLALSATVLTRRGAPGAADEV